VDTASLVVIPLRASLILVKLLIMCVLLSLWLRETPCLGVRRGMWTAIGPTTYIAA